MDKKKLLISIISAFAAVTVLTGVTVFAFKSGLTKKWFGKDDVVPVVVSTEPPVLEKLADTFNAAWLVPEVDYPIAGMGNEVQDMIESRLNEITVNQFNAVILPVTHYGDALYETELVPTANDEVDIVKYTLERARVKGLKVYAVLDVTAKGLDGFYNLSQEADRLLVTQIASELASKYQFDGLMLDNFFVKDDTLTPEALVTETTNALKIMKQDIRKANFTLYIGLCAEPVWENKTMDERGSETAAESTSLSKGADTLTWAKENLVDFVMVKASGSQTDTKIPFNAVTSWWSEAVKGTKTALFVSHSADKIGSDGEGWKEADQLSKQILALRALENYQGSAFYSIASLTADKTGSTEVLLKCLKNMESDGEETLKFTDLSFSLPAQTTITVNESKIQFYGVSDFNFTLMFNGEECERDGSGIIDKWVDLKIGDNIFKFENKGKIIEFKVTYKVVLLKSIAPTENLELSGGSDVMFSATALKGATVTATINKKSITLKQADIKSKDDAASEPYGEFCQYIGSYKVPAETAKAQNLGKISITASQNGLKETKTGGSVTVKVKPKNAVEIKHDPNPVSNEKIGNMDINSDAVIEKKLSKENATGNLITVNKYKAETFNASYTTTSIDWSRPENAYLPEGTQDIAVGETNVYTKLNFGKMVYTKDVKPSDYSTLPLGNELVLVGAELNTRNTVFTLNPTWKAPIGVDILPHNYSNAAMDNAGPHNRYAISSFTSTHVEISFHYATKFTGLPDLGSNHPLFESVELSNKEADKIILRFKLKKAGGFYGWNAEYNSKGQLVLTFMHSYTASSKGSLNGCVILLDPGHGGNPKPTATNNETSTGTANTINGKYYTEKALNLSLAEKIRKKLRDLGADVRMTRTEETKVNYDTRLTMCYDVKPNLFISIHHNGAENTGVYGLENYYFTPYSQQVALKIYNRILDVFKNKYNTTSQNPPNRGNRWGPYYANRVSICPSMLIEYGYMSNIPECSWIIQDATQEKFADATVQGILDYFNP